MGGSGKAVMSFALAVRDGGSGGNGCDKPSAPTGKITLNLPSLGGSIADINRAFGTVLDHSPSVVLVRLAPRRQRRNAADLDSLQTGQRKDRRRRRGPIHGQLRRGKINKFSSLLGALAETESA
jgi:hypothetical protein